MSSSSSPPLHSLCFSSVSRCKDNVNIMEVQKGSRFPTAEDMYAANSVCVANIDFSLVPFFCRLMT